MSQKSNDAGIFSPLPLILPLTKIEPKQQKKTQNTDLLADGSLTAQI
jgi:hypothetical protein